ncbi:Cell morphogenesis protein PAG1 [Chytriomyces hyalinus]|nr:Cell morphogenesis protein PAG1 [Chytriomyces hyalinus]
MPRHGRAESFALLSQIDADRVRTLASASAGTSGAAESAPIPGPINHQPRAAAENAKLTSTASNPGSLVASETTMRILFARFVEMAESKLLQLVYAHGGDMSIDLSVSLRPGVDPDFDGVLKGLGAIAKHCQKDLIEGLMAWRTDKSAASKARVPTWVAPIYLLKEMEKIVYNRQMMVSNFILLRAWIEIVQHMTKDMLQDSLATKMEYVAFNQLRYENPELVATNPTCRAHIDLNAEFLGKLSNIRFAKVTDGFVKEISELSKTVANRDPALQALKLEICIRAMRFIKLKIYPMDALEETVEFVNIFAGFFANSHLPRIKHAYCDIFVELLEPVVAVASAEVNVPTWKDGIEMLFGKAMRMIAKKGHIQHSLPLATTALCLSRSEFFVQNLASVIDICVSKLREKSMKCVAIVSLTRLLWVCAHRNADSLSAQTQKRVETLFKLIFPPRTTLINPTEVNMDLLVRMVYIAMAKYMENMMELFSSLLLSVDMSGTVNWGLNFTTSGSAGVTGGGALVNVSTGTLAGTNMSSAVLTASQNASVKNQSMKTLGSVGPSSSMGGSLASDRFNSAMGRKTDTASTLAGSGTNSGKDLDTVNTANNPDSDGANLREKEAWNSLKRKMIGIRAFLLLLADIETALEASSSSGGQSMSPWTNGFGGGAGGGAGSGSSGGVLVQGKIKLTAPPFPSLNLSEKADLSTLMSIQHRTATSLHNSLAGDHGLEASWVSNPARNQKPVESNGGKLSLAISNSSQQRMSNNVRIFIDRANNVFGTMFLALDKACGNLFWNNGDAGWTFNAQSTSVNAPENGSASQSRRSSMGDSSSNAGVYSSVPGSLLADPTAVSNIRKRSQFELLRNCIDCLPRLCPSGILAERIVEMLAVYTYHVDELIRISAVQALLRIGKIVQGVSDNVSGGQFWAFKGYPLRQGRSISEATAKIIFESSSRLLMERASDAMYHVGFDESLMEQTGSWVVCKLVEDWVKEMSAPTKSAIDVTEIETALYDIEGFGLTYLSSCNYAVRSLGVQLFKLARSLERLISDTIHARTPQADTTDLRAENPLENLDLRHHDSRILSILEESGKGLVLKYFCDPNLFDQENGAMKDHNRIHEAASKKDCLVRIAVSDTDEDSALWSRCLSDFSQYLLEYAHPSVLHRYIAVIGNRLHSLNIGIIFSETAPAAAPNNILGLANTQTSNLSKVFGITATGEQTEVLGPPPAPEKKTVKPVIPITEGVFSQWRNYLRISFAIIEVVELYPMPTMHSTSIGPSSPFSLFRMISTYFFMENEGYRKAGLACIAVANWRSYRAMFEVLYPYMKIAAAPKKAANLSGMESLASLIRSSERFRTELAHILSLLTDFMNYDVYRSNEVMFRSVVTFIGDTCRFLCDPEVQSDWEFSDLRYHFCVLVENFYQQVLASAPKIYSDSGEFNKMYEPNLVSRYFPFELRLRAFSLLESWCGFGSQAAGHMELQQKSMIKSLEALAKDGKDPAKRAEKMNAERAFIQRASLKAMAALCHGPLADPSSKTGFSFADIHLWINDLYNSNIEEFHTIAASAVFGVLLYNGSSDETLAAFLRECYLTSESNGSSAIGCFNAIVNILAGSDDVGVDSIVCRGAHPDYPCTAPKMVALGLFKVGDPDPEIRTSAMRLLRAVELRVWKEAHCSFSSQGLKKFLKPQLCDIDSGGTSPSILYKRVQAYLSSVWATNRTILTSFVVSELCLRIEQVSSREGIRDLLNILSPWIRNVLLPTTSDKHNGTIQNCFLDPDADAAIRQSEYLLTGLFYITVCFGDDFTAEVETIWMQLIRKSTGESHHDIYLNPVVPEEVITSHVHIVIDFLLALGVSRRNPLIIIHSKKVIGFLCRILGAEYLIQLLLSRINPISFTPMDNMAVKIGVPHLSGQHCINISSILLETSSRPPLTFGGLLSTFLVDLIGQARPDALQQQVPYILHIIFIQLDHFISLICEQMKSLLLRLIRNLNIKDKKEANRIIAKITLKEERRLWSYEDISPENQEIRSSSEMGQLVLEVLGLFSELNSDFLNEWTKTALFFAVNCPVRHAACRSLQILRHLNPPFNLRVFGELLLRFSTTAADKLMDIQSYSLEILKTIDAAVHRLSQSEIAETPQLFWASVAILSSPLEHEFIKGVEILIAITSKVNLNDPSLEALILQGKPSKWKGSFSGLQPLVIRGIQSSRSEGICLQLLNNLASIKVGTLVDTSSGRLVSSVLANYPRFMQGFEVDVAANGGEAAKYDMRASLVAAETLAKLADQYQQYSLGRLLLSYSKQRFRTVDDFVQQFVFSLRDNFFPTHQAIAMQLIVSLLSNKLPFYQKWALRLLRIVVPILQAESDSGGSAFSLIDVELDLISPCIESLKTSSSDDAASVLELLLTNESSSNDRFLRKNYSTISQEAYNKVMHMMENGNSSAEVSATGWKVLADTNRATKITRYNIASAVAACGISSISTQIVSSKRLGLKPESDVGRVANSQTSYRIPAVSQPSVLLSSDQKRSLLKAVKSIDDAFTDDSVENGVVTGSSSSDRPSNEQHLDRTGFKHILSQSNIGVQIIFRVQVPFRIATSSEAFVPHLISDVSNSLRIGESGIFVDQLDESVGTAGASGTLVTVALTGGGLLGDGTVAAAQAEELLALITKSEAVPERDVFWRGEITSSTDAHFEPKIIINFRGMNISYIPEGLRQTLPHRRNMSEKSNASIPSASNTENLSLSSRTEPDVSVSVSKSVEKGVETIRIFPAAFELMVQLHLDLAALIQDVKSVFKSESAEVFQKLLNALLSVRNSDKGYCPMLLRVGVHTDGTVAVSIDEAGLLAAGQKLMKAEPTRLAVFLNKREQHVQSINTQIASYLTSRRHVGTEISSRGGQADSASIQALLQLSISLMGLHGLILALEGVFDDFMGASEANNQARMDESLRCVQSRTLLRDLLATV